MFQRNKILPSNRGFSLAGTLVAVAIGAIVATLVATVITEAVKGQRSIIDRDEMSEFSLFIKSRLTNDSSCVRLLRDTAMPSGGNKEDLSLNEGYQDMPGPLQKDFTFAGNTLKVTELSLEDKGIPPVNMTAAVVGPTGATTVMPVRRVMAKIKLQLQHVNGTGYRARFFEIPVHVNSSGNIVGCNNEFNISDACGAMGFVYDPNPASPGFPCKPDRACYAGGTFVTGPGGSGCQRPHPTTGACACPAGHTPFLAGATNVRARSCGKRCCYAVASEVTHCMICP